MHHIAHKKWNIIKQFFVLLLNLASIIKLWSGLSIISVSIISSKMQKTCTHLHSGLHSSLSKFTIQLQSEGQTSFAKYDGGKKLTQST